MSWGYGMISTDMAVGSDRYPMSSILQQSHLEGQDSIDQQIYFQTHLAFVLLHWWRNVIFFTP